LLAETLMRESVTLSHPHRRDVGTTDSARAGAMLPVLSTISLGAGGPRQRELTGRGAHGP